MEGQPDEPLPPRQNPNSYTQVEIDPVDVVEGAEENVPKLSRREIRVRRSDIAWCVATPTFILALLFLAVGGPVSTLYCAPCVGCENGECVFFRIKAGNEPETGFTSCNLDVVFNGDIQPELRRETLTVGNNCTNSFLDTPADGVAAPCFLRFQRNAYDSVQYDRTPTLYVGSTTNLDPYEEQCPGMVAGMVLACVAIILSIVACCAWG